MAVPFGRQGYLLSEAESQDLTLEGGIRPEEIQHLKILRKNKANSEQLFRDLASMKEFYDDSTARLAKLEQNYENLVLSPAIFNLLAYGNTDRLEAAQRAEDDEQPDEQPLYRCRDDMEASSIPDVDRTLPVAWSDDYAAQVTPVFVELLKRIDPRSENTLLHLQIYLKDMERSRHTLTLPMYDVECQVADKSGTFFLHVGKGMTRPIPILDRSILTAASGGALLNSEDEALADANLGIMELVPMRSFAEEDVDTDGIPKYVVYIGEVFEQHQGGYNNGNNDENVRIKTQSSGYHVVMDVTHPNKSLWVVWKYDEEQQDGTMRDVEAPVRKASLPLHRAYRQVKWDLLALLESVDEWDGGVMCEGRSGPHMIMRRSKVHVRPRFTTPILEEMRADLERPWRSVRAPEA